MSNSSNAPAVTHSEYHQALPVRQRVWPYSHYGGAASSGGQAEQPKAPVAAKPEDVGSMDAIIAAVYAAISGPPGNVTGIACAVCSIRPRD